MKEQVKGIESYVPEEPLTQVKKRLGLKKLVRLSANENPFGTSNEVKNALLNWNFSEGNRYPDGNATQLRQAIATKLDVQPENLVFGVGLDEIIMLLSHIFLEKGDEVLLTKPTFSEYALHAEIEGCKVVEVPCNTETGGHSFAGMLAKITAKTKIIWLCNPNNPTGVYEKPAAIADFVAQVPADVLVVIDEAYIHYVTDTKAPSFLPFLDKYPNAVLMRTFSKAYGLANYRVGYAVMAAKLAAYMQAVRLPYNLNALSQTAALAALNDQKFVADSVQKTERERKAWEKFLTAANIKHFHSQANFIFFKYPDAPGLADMLLKNGYQLRRGLAKDWLRLTIGTAADGEKIRELIKAQKRS
ncbi:histidinol-phosphate transaminase [Liquorilactobacillus satsumensis]|uniref:histidinol-phosphate transaminase n=1 Tax=Liquorilactobacillus satsumensis TaxID=259059 RepID=UPI0021C34F4A|nr:histidinol-phosphate transaminase [Liquorilactobacillus satsumensis]MCP9313238.1 histidinol-phosphate transaminase [Liquorilactobacillus satsumensis]MCP9360401.1 histidinol-phosphate transaminase [Liquorilactobacillus satsumensis]